jgi:hypothetical protein
VPLKSKINNSTWEAEAGGSQIRGSMSYIARTCLNKTKQNKNVGNVGKNKHIRLAS